MEICFTQLQKLIHVNIKYITKQIEKVSSSKKCSRFRQKINKKLSWWKNFIILSINSLIPLYTRVECINLINWRFFFFLPPSLFSFSLINITKEFYSHQTWTFHFLSIHVGWKICNGAVAKVAMMFDHKFMIREEYIFYENTKKCYYMFRN